MALITSWTAQRPPGSPEAEKSLINVIDEPDIYRAAKILIDQHGEDAAERAERRASELWDEGDAEGTAVWRHILKAVDELTRPRPDDELVN